AGLNAGQEYVLRSGARIELGGWRLVFYREEYADHGRPYGGRNGGELAYQRPQVNPRTGIIERDSTD
ncbi:MAG: FHA domain-containing protein, partial [Glutamicibacter protophormiae]